MSTPICNICEERCEEPRVDVTVKESGREEYTIHFHGNCFDILECEITRGAISEEGCSDK